MTGSVDRVESLRRPAATELVRGRTGADRAEEFAEAGCTLRECRCRWWLGSTGRPDQVFTWRRLYAERRAVGSWAGEEVVPASEHRALQHQDREPQRLLGKKIVENEIQSRRAAEPAAPRPKAELVIEIKALILVNRTRATGGIHALLRRCEQGGGSQRQRVYRS